VLYKLDEIGHIPVCNTSSMLTTRASMLHRKKTMTTQNSIMARPISRFWFLNTGIFNYSMYILTNIFVIHMKTLAKVRLTLFVLYLIDYIGDEYLLLHLKFYDVQNFLGPSPEVFF
jgi:hypothetical protein